MTDEQFKGMIDQGYVLLRTKGTIKLPDGTEVNHVMVKKSDAEFRGLDRNQLPYAQGGHRLYEADYKYFVKQAAFIKQPDTGTVMFKNPNTFVAAKSITEARDWTKAMNTALRAYRDNNMISPADLDEIFARAKSKMPSGEEFVKQVKSGHINTKYDFEAVFDRELPSAYSKESASALSFIDVDDLGAVDYLGTTGRKYYSGKGEVLKDTTGDIATTVDPFEATSASLRQITRASALSDYKTEALERFMKTYGEYLEPGKWRSPMEIFNDAPIKRGTPREIELQINSQRAATKTVLGFQTDFERSVQQNTRSLAEWVIGEGNNPLRKALHDSIWWWENKNPINSLRGYVFDAKLGMFNVGQLLVQTSTMVSATALNPKYGMKGMFGVMPMHAFLMSKGSENMLDTLAKRGVGKLMGFNTEVEFKEYARLAYKSGFMDMNGSHVMVGEYGPTATFGSFGEKVHAAREAARTFFYSAETFNRLVAFRIAYGETLDAGVKLSDRDFLARVMQKADDYSFNMTEESRAWWQKGLLSIPTQFWAYNVRMMDAMFGGRFTPAQKARLMVAQVMLAGSTGIPVVEGISTYMKQQTGTDADINSLIGTLDRGLVDRFWYEATGADMRLGARLGTGGWVTDVVKDLFGAGEYKEKSFDEIVGGATWTITKETWKSLADVVEYSVAEKGAGPITKEHLLKMVGEISTISNAMKANMVANYGIYKSRSGTILADELPSQDAFFVAMGFTPNETEQTGYMMAYAENKTERIDEAAKQVRNWRQEAFSNPDKYDENMGKVNAFIALQRPEDRYEIIKKTNRITDTSLYDNVARKFNEETLRESLYNNGETN
jgi:hypothetical protein